MLLVGYETRNTRKRAVGDLQVLQRGRWNRQEQGGEEDNKGLQDNVYPSGTVRPLYRTGVSLLSIERFLYI